MREIKFRGKRTDNGEWVIGHLTSAIRVKDGVTTNHWLIGSDYDFHEVHPETIGQYTGLKDWKGQEIWEGDFIHLDSMAGLVVSPKGGDALFEVKNDGCDFILRRQDFEFDWGRLSRVSEIQWNIVHSNKNIHDNPNLLTQ